MNPILIGANLERLRKETLSNVSQAQFGAALGVHQSAVSRLEDGKQALLFVDALALVEVFNMPLPLLVTELTDEVKGGEYMAKKKAKKAAKKATVKKSKKAKR